MIPVRVLEEVIDASGIPPRIEAMLPIGVRGRQLSVRTVLAGMCLSLADGRPAHLTRVHQALTSLPEDEQRRLGVIADWEHGPHLLTYRQAGYTSSLVAGALGKGEPDGLPSPALQAACDDLLEASIPGQFKNASSSLAADWTDLESFSRPRPPPHGISDCAGIVADEAPGFATPGRGDVRCAYSALTRCQGNPTREDRLIRKLLRRVIVVAIALGTTVGASVAVAGTASVARAEVVTCGFLDDGGGTGSASSLVPGATPMSGAPFAQETTGAWRLCYYPDERWLSLYAYPGVWCMADNGGEAFLRPCNNHSDEQWTGPTQAGSFKVHNANGGVLCADGGVSFVDLVTAPSNCSDYHQSWGFAVTS